MTRDEIKQAIATKSDEWLESRWSVLNEASKVIEPHMAEVEAAFDHDYGMAPDIPDTLEKTVSDQVCEICNVVTTHDTEGTMSWGELLEFIDLEIKKREEWRSDENQKQIKGLAKPAVMGIKIELPVGRPQKGHGQG